MRRIVLASASPRRKELLGKLGLKFEVFSPDIEENYGQVVNPGELAVNLSRDKAQAAAPRFPDAVIIAADTIGWLDSQVLGKPGDSRAAFEMLKKMSGRAHLVVTGYTVLDTSSGKQVSASVGTKVYFRTLSDAEIDAYVKTGEPLDKAGAYAIQGLGALLVEKIEGDFFNVIGLPLGALSATLKEFGICLLPG